MATLRTRVVVPGLNDEEVLEESLLDDADVQRQIDYIHADPVRHGVVRSPQKWPYSSLHAYIAGGLRLMYWSSDVVGGYGAKARRGP